MLFGEAESNMIRPWYRARSLNSLGTALSQARKDAGFDQNAMAEAINSSRPTISRMERGEAVSSATVWDAVARSGYEIIIVPRGAQVRIEE